MHRAQQCCNARVCHAVDDRPRFPSGRYKLSLAERARAHGLMWYGLPITDGAAPDARLLGPWRSLGPQFAAKLLSGTRIVVHCKGGLGRAGTVASMLLIETGFASDGIDAIAKVRSVRPGAVETAEQEEFILNWSNRGARRLS